MSERGLRLDAVVTAGGMLGTTFLAGLTSLLITRGLTQAERGAWGVVGATATLAATIGSLGLPVAASYAAARAESAERAALVRAACVGGAVLGVLASLAAFVVLVISRPEGVPFWALAVGGALAGLLLLHQVTQQLTLTALSTFWFALSAAIPAAVMLVVILGLVLAGDLDVPNVAVASGATTTLGTAIALGGLVSAGLWARDRMSPRGIADTLRPYLGYALLTSATLGVTHVVQKIDVLLVNGFKGADDAGLYVVAVQYGDLLLVLPGALGLVMFRRGARSSEGHWEDVLRVLRWTALFGLAAAAVSAVIAPWILELLFGPAYRESSTALRLLLPGVVLLGLQSVISNYVASRGRPRAVLVAWTASAVFGLVADLWAIPHYGIDGAAAVSSLSYLLVLLLHLQALRALRPAPGAVEPA
jgi:O-antigen/teichoic acid export membrane protein